MVIILKVVLGVMTGLFGAYYLKDALTNCRSFSDKPWPGILGTGFITNFLDTLGIGSFAQQTAIFKIFKLVDDRLIPGTLNVGNTFATVAQAFIFMKAVPVDPVKLVSMSVAAPVGAVLGAGQTIGVGFYALCMAMVFTFGMDPKTAFPIMMTATAMLMAAGAYRFIKEKVYDRKVSLALTVSGVLGVFLAAYFVKSLPVAVIKWLVCGVVFYTSITMFISAKSD